MRRRSYTSLIRQEKMLEYMNSTFTFFLWYGDTCFKTSKVMTGREAYEENRAFEKKFFNDHRPGVRLWRWYKEGSAPLPKGTTLNDYRRMKRNMKS